ncbi:RsmF rRNA methyltransferase first C-terminal domain-containing protein, partial [Gemmiger formicilis]|uniref:RsmF rRNA methyltransferase first C-terminal domain-containing protein n=1 Tax=Gemmiger formicilis TaxID=745368 RepID=UPI0019599F54
LLPPVDSEQLPVGKLRLLRGGVLAGSVVKKRFQPAHALFMAYGAACTNREELTRDDPRTIAWLRGEEIEAGTAQNGWCAVCVDGFPLGAGKVSGGRIKNHYPKGLRNLG